MGDELCALLEEGERDKAYALLHGSPTIEAEVLRASLRWAHGGPEALEAAIEGEMIKRRRELERGMTLLGTLGNNAPFVGLLGTVIGVIVAFADLADGQNKVQMDKVMGGIAEALIATGVGLFVAIPAVVACYLVSGSDDFLIEAAVPDLAGYEQLLLDQVLAIPDVTEARSTFAIRTVLSRGPLPLEHWR